MDAQIALPPGMSCVFYFIWFCFGSMIFLLNSNDLCIEFEIALTLRSIYVSIHLPKT